MYVLMGVGEEGRGAPNVLKSAKVSHAVRELATVSGCSIYVACFADAFAALFLLSFIH